MESLKLKTPIKINGKEVRELTYDIEAVTSDLYLEALARKTTPVKGQLTGALAEIDAGIHLTIGMAAVIAVNPEYDFEDLNRIKGRDIVSIMKVGRSFFTASESSEEEDSQLDSSASESVTTDESITHQSGS